jgi:hypothetical protein
MTQKFRTTSSDEAMQSHEGAPYPVVGSAITGMDRTWLSGVLEFPFGRGINLQIRTDKVDELHDHVKKSGARIFLTL